MSSSNKTALPDTLALRVQALREKLDMTPRQLAAKAILPLNLIQDVEAGLELFLAPAIRVKLARALRVRADVIQEVERFAPEPEQADDEASAQAPEVWRIQAQMAEIQHRPNQTYTCMLCQSPLVVRQFERLDLEENPIIAYKVTCSQCLFSWSSD